MTALNLSSGSWPYLLHEDSAFFTVTRLGDNFTQAKVPGAVYEFEPDAIKETIVLSSPSEARLSSLGVRLSGSYLPYAHGSAVSLLDRQGNVVWQSEPFTARDSSLTPQVFTDPVQSVVWAPGGLTIHLDPNMVTWAQYPLYIDPTWVLTGSTSNGWSGTLDALTNDRGDANLRLGVLADDFNDNINEGWTVTSGHSYSLGGGRASLTATEIHASGSWSNLSLGTTLNFASCGASNVMFRYASSSNYYYLNVNFAGTTVALYKVIAGVTTALSSTLSIPMSATTNYDVKIVARSNSFEIWWAGVKKWSGTDPSPPGTPLSGNVGISETTNQCTLYVDNVRARDPAKWSGNYTSVKRGAASGNVATQVRFLGTADAYNVTDLWINTSSDNITWGGWHLVKTMAASGFYYPIPDVDPKRYYQVRAVLRTGLDGTSSVSEIDVTETSPPSNVVASTNTGRAPWFVYVGGEVNAVSGNLVLTLPGMSIPAKGDSISVEPTYNSLVAGIPGPFGLGTMDEFHMKLTFPSGGNITLTAGDGAVYTFVTMGGNAFSPPPSIHDDLVRNADGTYTLWQPDGSRANFDATGKLTVLVDRNGNHRTLTYTSGNPTRIADDSGLALTLGYDAGNRVKNVTDPAGRKVTYTYDGSGRLVQVADPLGFTENYTSFDTANRLLVRVDRAGHVDRFVYDTSGRVSQMWIGEWNYATSSIRWQVDEYALAYVSGTQTTVTNALGGVTTITVNSKGNPTNISGPSIGCGLCSGGNSTAYAWDGEFNRLTLTNGRGDTTSFSYDWMGNALSSRDPGGNTTTQAFWNVQNATQFITLLTSGATPRGSTTRYAYYANGNLYSTTHSDNAVSYRFYDAAGSLIRLQDFRGNSVTYGYDSHEFRVNSTDAGGNRTTYQNDAIGRTWNMTSPGGNTTRKVFDLDSRVTSATDPMGNTTQYTYDKDGRQAKVTDPNNLVRTSSYNLTFGALQQRVSAGNNVTRYVYDAMGDRNQTIDADSHVTKYAYDAFRRMLNETTPRNEVTRFVYDRAGNLAVKTEANGTVIRYTYDRSNRLLRTVYPGGTSQTNAYDADGNVKEKKAFELDDFYVYDKLDRVNQTRQVFLDTALTVWHNYTYDANGNRLSMDGYGGGSYTWDKNNRIWSETDALGNRWTYAYGKDGQLLKETYPNGGYVTYVYDRDGRMTRETSYRSGGSVLEQLTYGYDKVGNVVTSGAPLATQDMSTWHYATCCSALTSSLTGTSLTPSPQTVTISVYVRGLVADNVDSPPNCASPTVTWYYILNGGTVQIGSQTLNLNKVNGCYATFQGSYSASVSLHNGDVLQGKVAFQNDSVVTTSISALSVSFQASIGGTTYTYDREYRLYNASYPDGTYGRYTYDAVGNRLTYKNSMTTTTSTYNADNELTSSTDGKSYTYDANGDLVMETVGSLTTHFAYDYAGDLTPVLTTKVLSTTTAIGSCTTPGGSAFAGCSATLTVPSLLPSPQTGTVTIGGSVTETDQIDSYPNCPTRTVTWSYVLNGAVHTLGSQTLSLNNIRGCRAVFSRTFTPSLTLHNGDTLFEGIAFLNDTTDPATYSVSVSTFALGVPPYIALQYGPDSVRSAETVNSGTTIHFGYDLLGMGGLPQEVVDYSGTTVSTSYCYGVGSDRPLDLIQGTAGYFYHRDDLSSTTTITDASDSVVASYAYDAYGNPKQAADTVGNPLRYTGSPWDPTTGLIDDRARVYDPTTGRFLTPDPMGGGYGYAYAGGNPVNRVDPSGKAWVNNGALIEGGNGGQGCSMTLLLQGYCAQGTAVTIDPSKAWGCTESILMFVGSLALGFLGIYLDLNALKGGAYLLAGNEEQDVTAFLGGDILALLNIFIDLGSYFLMQWTRTASIWDLLWTGSEDALKLTPVGIGVEAGFLIATTIFDLPGLIHDCTT